jgi:imidazolonepropionase-like amidohydrolase
MLAGTDTPLPGIHPGRSLHEELALLVDAGLSPYDALATATVNAGRFVREHVATGARVGTVEPGMRADLLLVDGDPRGRLAVLRAPRGVMAAGRWWDGATLDAMRAGR